MNINENSNLKKSNTVEESRRDSSRENMSPYEEITVMKTEIKEEQCDYEVPLDNVDLENIKEECFSSPENNFKEEVAEQNQLDEQPSAAPNEIITINEKDSISFSPQEERVATEKGVIKSVASTSVSNETKRNTPYIIRRREPSRIVTNNQVNRLEGYREEYRRYYKLKRKYFETEFALKMQELESIRKQHELKLELLQLQCENRKLELEMRRKFEL